MVVEGVQTVVNNTSQNMQQFVCEIPLKLTPQTMTVEFYTDELYAPIEHGISTDVRRLGFALKRLECV